MYHIPHGYYVIKTKTNSDSAEISSRMKNINGGKITDMRIRMSDNNYKVYMWECEPESGYTLTDVPPVEVKTWKVEKLDSVVKVWCNGVIVFSFDMADSSVSACSTENWANSKMDYIQFLENDDATEEFCNTLTIAYVPGR